MQRNERDRRNDPPVAQLSDSSVDLERSILGACLSDLDRCIDLLGVPSEHFSTLEHRELAEVLRALALEDREPDFAVVREELRKRGREISLSELALLSQEGLGVDLPSRIELLAEAHLRRRIGQTVNGIMRDLTESEMSAEEIAAKAVEALSSLSVPVEESITDVFGTLNTLVNEGLAGVKTEAFPTGIHQIDIMSAGGLSRQKETILAAPPGVGKSALALQIGLNVARQGKVVLYFSLEMPAAALGRRVIAASCGVEPAAIRLGLPKERWEKIQREIQGRYAGVPMYICDDPAMTSAKAAALCRRMKRQRGLDMLIVDYLQRLGDVQTPGENRNQLLGRISRTFHILARQLDMSVLLISQLNRAANNRQDSRPRMSDLRDSGELEADADNIWLLHRPRNEDPNSEQAEVELIIEKSREGPRGVIKLHFDGQSVRFLGLDDRRG